MSTGLLDQLADYGTYHDESQGSLDAADIMATPLHSGSTVVELDVQRRGLRLRGVLVAAAAAVAVLLVVGGVAWLFRSADGVVPVDQPANTVPPTSIDGPAGTTVVLTDLTGTPVDSETFHTEVVATEVASSSIGDLQWTVISIDPPLPSAGRIVTSPVGFASVSSDGRLLLSENTVDWRAVTSPFPGDLEEVFRHGGEYLMNATGQWRSQDFVTWTLSGSQPQAPPGLAEWVTGPGLLKLEFDANPDGETPDGAHLTHAIWRIDWTALALEVGGDGLQRRLDDGAVLAGTSWDPVNRIVDVNIWASREEKDAGEFALEGGRSDGPQPSASGVQIRLSISGTVDDWVVELEDLARSQIIGSITGSLPPLGPQEERLPGLTLDDTAESLATDRLAAFFLLSEDGMELVAPPPFSDDAATFVLTDDQLYVYERSGAWRSPDGRTWQKLDTENVPTIHVGDPSRDFSEGPGGVLVAAADVTEVDLGSGFPMILRSDDGVNWARPSQPPVFRSDDGFWFSHLAAADSGFLFLIHEDGELVLWTSVDGDIWERVEAASPFDPPTDQAGSWEDVNSSGNFVIITTEGPQAPSTAWIIEINGTQ